VRFGKELCIGTQKIENLGNLAWVQIPNIAFLSQLLCSGAGIAQLVYRWATGWKIGVLGFGNSSAEVKECVELYLHSPVRLHGVVLS